MSSLPESCHDIYPGEPETLFRLDDDAKFFSIHQRRIQDRKERCYTFEEMLDLVVRDAGTAQKELFEQKIRPTMSRSEGISP